LSRQQGVFQILPTISGKSGWRSHQFSNLKGLCLGVLLMPKLMTRGTWSLSALETPLALARGYNRSKEVFTRILSRVAIMGLSWLLNQVKLLEGFLISKRP